MEKLTEFPVAAVDDDEAFKQIMVKMIDLWMEKYRIQIYDLDKFVDHECERCFH